MKRMTMACVAAAMLLAACGGGTEDTGGVASLAGDADLAAAATEQAAALSDDETLLAFAQCMRDEGVDFPDPEVGDDGGLRLGRPGGDAGEIDREAMETARDACGDLLEGAVTGGPGGRAGFDGDTFLAFAECMRDEGIADFPDPGADGRPDVEAMIALDRDSDEFAAATETCAADSGFEAPAGGPGGGGPGGGGPGGGGFGGGDA